MNKALPDSIIKQNQMEFIKIHGFELQQHALKNYSNYKEERGALVIQIDDIAHIDTGDVLYACVYTNLKEAKERFGSDDYVIRMIQEYNPESEFVIVFYNGQNQRVDGYRIKQNKK